MNDLQCSECHRSCRSICSQQQCALAVVWVGMIAGKEFEARLRQQHTKLNPRTSWAQVHRKKKANKKRGFGDESDEE